MAAVGWRARASQTASGGGEPSVENQEHTGRLVGRLAAEQLRLLGSVVSLAWASGVTLTGSAAGLLVAAADASVVQSGAAALVAGQDLHLTTGGGGVLVAGRDLTVRAGGGVVLVAGRDLRVARGGGGVLVASEAAVERGAVALLVAGRTTVADGGRVLLGLPQAAALGAALGLVLVLLGRWVRRATPPA
jgi:hypothetical protein